MDTFEPWEDEVTDLITSRLYSIEPIGIGTLLSESLTSYICRLAEAHCVHTGTLIAEEIAPLMGKEYLRKIVNRGGEGYSDCAVGLNGMGKGAKDCSNALMFLTGRGDLESLTLLSWSNLFPFRGLLRVHRAWCPICISEWYEENQVIYEPLIWNVKEVDVCINHLVPLVTDCPNSVCQHTQPILNRYTRPGYCSKCGEWMGVEFKKLQQLDTNDYHMEWQIFKAHCIGQLISHSPNEFKKTVDLSNNLIAYVDQITNGNVAAFARTAKIPKVTFWDWYTGQNKPTLGGLLKICFCLGINLVEMLMDPPKQIKKEAVRRFICIGESNSPSQRRFFDMAFIEDYLKSVLKSEEIPPPSMMKVASRIGFHRKQLYKYFPEMCRSISLLHRKYVKNQRLIRIEETINEVGVAITQIINSGRYPSGKVVECEIGKPGAMKELQIRATWRNCLKKNGI